MSKLFIDLYLDEDVHVLVAVLLRHYGYSAITTRDAGNLMASDDDQMAFAVENKRTIVTHNRVDFENLAQKYFVNGRDHTGMIIAVRRTPYEIAKRILKILDEVTGDEMINQIRYI